MVILGQISKNVDSADCVKFSSRSHSCHGRQASANFVRKVRQKKEKERKNRASAITTGFLRLQRRHNNL